MARRRGYYRNRRRYYSGYRKNKYDSRANKKKTGLEELKNNTDLTIKSFFADHLLSWLENPTVPQVGYMRTSTGNVPYFVLCQLPYGCFAVYIHSKVKIAEGVDGTGTPKFMGNIEYGDVGERMFSNLYGLRISEEEFVLRVKEYLQHCYPNYKIN